MKAIYIRTSTDEQNPENQLKDCESLLEGDYILYRDKQSAFKDNVERKDFNKLKEDIKKGKIKEIYVWDFDRLFRNRLKFKEFLSYLKLYKVKLYSYNQDWIDNINKIPEPWNEIVADMLIQIFGYIAEEESAQKGRRVRLAMRIKKDGVYSYKGNKWGRKQLSTQKKNKINILHKNGMSIRNIAKELNISIGGVHKYIKEKPIEKTFNNRICSKEVN